MINLLLAGGPDTKLKKADVIEAARLTLKRDNITENEYKKVSDRLGSFLFFFLGFLLLRWPKKFVVLEIIGLF